VPYHNWLHAADAAQFVYIVFSNASVRNYLNQYEMFALLFAAITHDIDHDGRNNAFHRKTESIHAQLASTNLPPLELHHASLTMNILNLKFGQVLEKWSEEDKRKFETFVIACILATDMERHGSLLKEFRTVGKEFDKENPAIDFFWDS
jgi:hypothetical protein